MSSYQYRKSHCGDKSLISTMGFPILVRWHLYIELGPRSLDLSHVSFYLYIGVARMNADHVVFCGLAIYKYLFSKPEMLQVTEHITVYSAVCLLVLEEYRAPNPVHCQPRKMHLALVPSAINDIWACHYISFHQRSKSTEQGLSYIYPMRE